jgi:amino acid permease
MLDEHLITGVSRPHGHAASGGKAGWVGITAIILASLVGTGVLSLGFAAAATGWLPAATMILLSAAGGLYSGLLYYRLFLVVPSAKALADVGAAAYGTKGETSVRAVAYFFMSGVAVVFHLTATTAFSSIFNVPICSVAWSVITGAIVLVISQVRNIHELGGLSVVRTSYRTRGIFF